MTFAVVSPGSQIEKTVLGICNFAETVGNRVWGGVQLHAWCERFSVDEQTHLLEQCLMVFARKVVVQQRASDTANQFWPCAK